MQAEEALGAPQTGLFFMARATAAAPDARRATWVAPGAGGPVNWSLWVRPGPPVPRSRAARARPL